MIHLHTDTVRLSLRDDNSCTTILLYVLQHNDNPREYRYLGHMSRISDSHDKSDHRLIIGKED